MPFDASKIRYGKIKEEEQLIKNKLISKQDELDKNHFTHLLSDGNEIKVNIFFREIISNSKNVLVLQSNDISESLKHLNTIETQNEKLKKIAWTQSHIVRAPLSRVLGIINMLEEQTDDFEQTLFWLKHLRISANEMDEIVKNIVRETNDLE